MIPNDIRLTYEELPNNWKNVLYDSSAKLATPTIKSKKITFRHVEKFLDHSKTRI